jgi:hypothetical protein
MATEPSGPTSKPFSQAKIMKVESGQLRDNSGTETARKAASGAQCPRKN